VTELVFAAVVVLDALILFRVLATILPPLSPIVVVLCIGAPALLVSRIVAYYRFRVKR